MSEAAAISELHGVRILIVDDEVLLADLVAEDLREFGAECQVAHSVETAVASLASVKFDLVISDVRMSGRSGLDLIKSMRVQGDGPPVVLMTGHSEYSFDELLKAGAVAVLQKPFAVEDIVKVSISAAKAKR